ncbi:hypothetical protein ON010_g2650 [Phytophthora cinnamomi]|nr:hypothetical protein ON010_g2650 [Phytophthora cinnamomi]
MARSDCENDYKVFAKELSLTKPAAAEHLNGIDKCYWVKHKCQEAFMFPTYDETTSNHAEQASSWIDNNCRSAKPLEALTMFFRKLSELVSEQRQQASNWLIKRPGAGLVPLLAGERTKLLVPSDQCTVTPCLEGAYNIRSSRTSNHCRPWRLADLPGSECTCGNWRDKEFPGVHATAAAMKEGKSLDRLYDAKRMPINQIIGMYMVSFRPWPTDGTLE